jgi:hypothetical protein
VRKYLKRRSKSILEQAERERGDQEEQKYKKLEEDLKHLKGVLEDLPEQGGKRIGRMHRQYLGARPPDPGGEASAGYRMRMLTRWSCGRSGPR